MLSICFEKLKQGMAGYDIIIVIAAVVAAGLLAASVLLARAIENRLEQWREKKNISFSSSLNTWLNICYSLFTTMITLFPLLGMLGTVMALLGLNLSVGDMENIKNNFFNALTSTAWGIIFAGGFKLIHAVFVTYIENQIEGSKGMSVDVEARLLKAGKQRERR